jgi:hypothetical protein
MSRQKQKDVALPKHRTARQAAKGTDDGHLERPIALLLFPLAIWSLGLTALKKI